MPGFSSIRRYLPLLLLVIVPACAYLNSLDGEFVFDDSRIYASPALRLDAFSLTGLVHAVRGMEPATRPVANLSFILNYLVHGFDVRGYHLVNLAVHILTGLLLYSFLRTTLALPALQGRYPFPDRLAFAASLLWLVHPLQTQAVSYIVQRMTSLSALFFILSLLLYARGRTTDSRDRRFLLFGGSFLAGLLALGTKETAIVLPLFVLLYEWFFVQDLRRDWLARNKIYLLGTLLALACVALLFLGRDPLGALQAGYAGRDFTPVQRVLSEFRVILLYLGLLLFPSPGRLSLEHDLVPSVSLLSPPTTLPAMVLLLALAGLAVLLAPRYRLESFCILWFLGGQLVEGSILPLELVFEHRNYLPSMMAITLLVLVAGRFIQNRTAQAVLLAGVVAVLSFWTYQRNFVWHDELRLWSDCVGKAPNVARVHNNLAVALKRAGRLDEAIVQYRETIRLDPRFVEAYYNLGNVMALTGKLGQAVEYYRQAVLLRPDLPALQLSLANSLFDSGRYAEAQNGYLQVLRLDPGNAEARLNLDRTERMLQSLGQRPGAGKGP